MCYKFDYTEIKNIERHISDVYKEIKMATERLTVLTEIFKLPQKD
jgi:hypothetical protein